MVASPKTQPKVCMLTGAFPPDYSGAGKQAYFLTKELQARGVDCMVLTRHLTNKERSAKGDVQVEVDGIKVHRLCFDDQAMGIPFSVRAARFLWKNRHQIDIVHCHGVFWPSYVAILWARICRKATLSKVTQFGTDNLKAIERRRLGQLQVSALRNVDRIVAISRELAADYYTDPILSKKVVQLPNGVDTQTFMPISEASKVTLRQRLNLPTETLLVSFVGIIKDRKGVDLLVESWIRLANMNDQTHLLLAGPCDDTSLGGTVDLAYIAQLRQQIEQAQLTDRVIWSGQVDEVIPYLQASDIFVLPSRREGLPNALLEAMACGLACIATNLDGVSEVMPPEAGLQFPMDDVDALTTHLAQLANEPEARKQYGMKARAQIQQNFSLDSIADRYVEMYQQLCLKLQAKNGAQL